jgi:hypothetical protein
MKKSSIPARKGGNGGYSKKSTPTKTHGPIRKFNLRDYHGKKVKR